MRFDEAVRAAMFHEMDRDPSVFAYGEGINDPGGFFGTTAGLHLAFGERCLDVPNSEEALVGFGLGAALGGLRPIFVNLRIEFLLLAANALVNHVAKWGDLQGRDVPVPFTIRAMVGRGWGQGAQHSGSYASMLAHVPGLQVAIPSGPAQAAGLLVSAVRGNRPTVLIEPKAVYDTTEELAGELAPVPIGRAVVRRAGSDLTLVAVGDAVNLALRVAGELAEVHGVEAEVIDACSLAPFDAATIVESVTRTGRVGVVDIGWAAFGLAAEVARGLLSAGVSLRAPMASWAPEGHAPAGCFAEARHYPTDGGVLAGALALVRE
ncbi:MAG: alpha-ketoacid dehydrogenase subunit beta [Acidimicrobiales bacterium]